MGRRARRRATLLHAGSVGQPPRAACLHVGAAEPAAVLLLALSSALAGVGALLRFVHWSGGGGGPVLVACCALMRRVSVVGDLGEVPSEAPARRAMRLGACDAEHGAGRMPEEVP